jgi:hypothetical protein
VHAQRCTELFLAVKNSVIHNGGISTVCIKTEAMHAMKALGILKGILNRGKSRDKPNNISSEVPLFLPVFMSQLVSYCCQCLEKLPTLTFFYLFLSLYKITGSKSMR